MLDLDFAEIPVWFVGLMLLTPLIREFHFHWIHRMIDWPPMYKWVHSVHHRNANSGILIDWMIPSHPIHATLSRSLTRTPSNELRRPQPVASISQHHTKELI